MRGNLSDFPSRTREKWTIKNNGWFWGLTPRGPFRKIIQFARVFKKKTKKPKNPPKFSRPFKKKFNPPPKIF